MTQFRRDLRDQLRSLDRIPPLCLDPAVPDRATGRHQRFGYPLAFTPTMKTQTAVKPVVKDLVCGMDVDTAKAVHSEHAGHTYYFCGSKCEEKFKHSPAQYVDKAPKTSCGCCA